MKRPAAALTFLAVLAACDGSSTGPEEDERTPGPPTFVAVSAGDATACGLTSGGKVYCWGSFYDTIPTLVPGTYSFRSISAGVAGPWDFIGFHACGITEEGRAFCWGGGGSGQLGDGTYHRDRVEEPVAVSGDLRFTHLALGDASTCGIAMDGSAYCWGEGWSTVPTRLPGDLRFTKLSAGQWFYCGITTSGQTWCWGVDDLGQLGDGVEGSWVNDDPARVLGGEGLSSISSGFDHTCGFRPASGLALCWGYNGAGQIDDGTRVNRDSAVIAGRSAPSVISVAAGGDWSCGVTPEGRVYCWGDMVTRFGRMVHERDAAERVTGLPPMSSLALGEWFGCGLSQDGWIYCWGENYVGQLGRRSELDSDAPWQDPEPVAAPR